MASLSLITGRVSVLGRAIAGNGIRTRRPVCPGAVFWLLGAQFGV